MNNPIGLRDVLVVDDEPAMRRVLEIMLGRLGCMVVTAGDGAEALQRALGQSFDLVLTDLRMPVSDGIELLRGLRAAGLSVPVILMTAHGSIESAVAAMRLGACDYLLRPFDVEALELAIRRVAAHGELLRRNHYLSEVLEAGRGADGLVGDSPAMRAVQKQIAQVAPGRTSVLLTGETGTGKEVVARAIHRQSPRHDALFVALNCAAIPAEILESELFGHERGAFSGALRERIGKFELADGGTLFLDEITEMPLALQAKLLRVLQEGTLERLGSNRTRTLDLRVIAASNRPPAQAIAEGRLREDLYYRLNVFAIELPPLRDRLSDLPALVRHFAATLGTRGAPPLLSPAALKHLQAWTWPGNVRELRNVVERALLLAGGAPTLEVEHFPLARVSSANVAPAAAGAGAGDALPEHLDLDAAVAELESRYLREALRRSDGHKTRAAALLGFSERTVWYKLKKYGLDKSG